jgi:hypothetical protein
VSLEGFYIMIKDEDNMRWVTAILTSISVCSLLFQLVDTRIVDAVSALYRV